MTRAEAERYDREAMEGLRAVLDDSERVLARAAERPPLTWEQELDAEKHRDARMVEPGRYFTSKGRI